MVEYDSLLLLNCYTPNCQWYAEGRGKRDTWDQRFCTALQLLQVWPPPAPPPALQDYLAETRLFWTDRVGMGFIHSRATAPKPQPKPHREGYSEHGLFLTDRAGMEFVREYICRHTFTCGTFAVVLCVLCVEPGLPCLITLSLSLNLAYLTLTLPTPHVVPESQAPHLAWGPQRLPHPAGRLPPRLLCGRDRVPGQGRQGVLAWPARLHDAGEGDAARLVGPTATNMLPILLM